MVDTTYHYMVQYSSEFFKRVVFFQMNIKRERLHIVIAGLIIGVIASLQGFFGNPANMGFCIACFLRDTAGGLGLHRAAAVQYIRPEIIDVVLFREPKLLMGFGAILISALVCNLILTGSTDGAYFHLAFEGQPIAHTDGLWNCLGMVLVGFGCGRLCRAARPPIRSWWTTTPPGRTPPAMPSTRAIRSRCRKTAANGR